MLIIFYHMFGRSVVSHKANAAIARRAVMALILTHQIARTYLIPQAVFGSVRICCIIAD